MADQKLDDARASDVMLRVSAVYGLRPNMFEGASTLTIAELMERAAVNTITTVETLLEAAWGIMKEARAKDDFSAASATLERAAKIAGLWVDQSKQQSANVTTVFSATPLTADEWSQQHSPETLQ